MKISYDKIDLKNIAFSRRYSLKYTLKESILKTDFKKLMKISHYKSAEKIGYVYKNEESNFIELCNKIENSDAEKCRKSHEKSKEKFMQMKNHSKRECPDCSEYISFNGDHECWESGLTY